MLFQRLVNYVKNFSEAVNNAVRPEDKQAAIIHETDKANYQFIQQVVKYGGDLEFYEAVRGIIEGRYRPQMRAPANRRLLVKNETTGLLAAGERISYLAGAVYEISGTDPVGELIGHLGLLIEVNGEERELVFYNEYGERFVGSMPTEEYVQPRGRGDYVQPGIYLDNSYPKPCHVIVLRGSVSPGIQVHVRVIWDKSEPGNLYPFAVKEYWVAQTIEDDRWRMVRTIDVEEYVDADVVAKSMTNVLSTHFGDVIPRWEFFLGSDLVDSEYSKRCIAIPHQPEGKLPRIVDKLLSHLESTKPVDEAGEPNQQD
jgi:hypothetical protein